MADYNGLKKSVFTELLEAEGRVFVVVRYSESVSIGRRGFLPEEKEKGIALVFNRGMNFGWDESGIHAKLVFGSSAEKCYIPADDIVSVYNPESGVHLTVLAGRGDKPYKKPIDAGNIIEVDFRKK